ncbi:XRE family transcriptional regulator [Vibrio sp. T187]|uniref:helix-turn-helix domain-containing protein n=1 Tax=Vibrio TaxID=662 RepID=UPI0010C99E5B|nr:MULTISPECIES: helix-turn-helix transcriptional regulator [Vibrio]MBW3698191.1 XRE family transcriptional regulator [Vibrio sp. T187]
MSESILLIAELKKQLKLHGVTYQDIAKALSLTEGSVKRLFAQGNNLSLDRLEQICQLIGLEMAELFRLASRSSQQLMSLEWQQEEQLVADKGLLLVAVCVVNGYKFEQIVEQYCFSETELIQMLAHLDRLKVIELLPGNRIKLRISPSFSWLAGGPIQQFFQQQVQAEFFKSNFTQPDEKLLMATGLMSIPSNQKLQQRLHKLVQEFYSTCQRDDGLDMDQRHGTSMIVAIRRWNFPLFDQLENKPSASK